MCDQCARLGGVSDPHTTESIIAPTALATSFTATTAVAPDGSSVTTNAINALQAGYSWSGTTGQADTIRYSFTQATDFSDQWGLTNQATMSAAQQVQAEAGMQLWANVANVTFVETTGYTDINIRLATMQSAAGWMAAKTTNTTQLTHTDVVIDHNYSDMVPGTWDFMTIVHEIGHALGLKHPGNYGGSSGGYYLSAAEDTRDVSIMSYYNGKYTTSWTHIPESPMIYDIAAIQFIYGANHNYNSGNTTYAIDGSNHIYTIWDGAGIDTISAASTATNNIIDLREGVSNVTTIGLTNFWVAFGADIENATGGKGNDTIYGNDLDNVLDGLTGVDILYGYEGSDTLQGGAGGDTLTGGTGVDTFIINKSSTAVNITINDFDVASGETLLLQGFTQSVDFADLTITQSGSNSVVTLENGITITLKNVTAANLTAASFGQEEAAAPADTVPAEDDSLTGTEGNDSLTGTANADSIEGFGGNDTLIGGAGNDTLEGGSGYNKLDGGDGDDVLIVTGRDTVLGGAGNDTIDASASTGANTIDAGSGADSVVAGKGNNTIAGGLGDDDIYAGGGNNKVDGGDGNDTIVADGGKDRLVGGTGDDTLTAGAGYDTLDGGTGNDILLGGSGRDTFLSNTGNDVLVGGADSDTFYFGANTGHDIISDFGGAGRSGGDLIRISSSIYSSAKAALAHVSYVDGDAVVDLGAHGSITLVDVSYLVRSDFAIF